MKALARAGLESAAVNRLLGATSRRGGILAYHGVAPDDEPCSPLHVTAGQFRAQLESMSESGYRFIELPEMLARLRAGRSVARCVSVTFDDAYRGLALALPVLHAMQAPATVFVPTGSIGTGMPFWWDRLDRIGRRLGGGMTELARALGDDDASSPAVRERTRARVLSDGRGVLTPVMREAFARVEGGDSHPDWEMPMTWDELRGWLSWEGASCAPHTVSHPVLPLLDEQEQRREIGESLSLLREKVDRVLTVIAYPYGLYDGTTLRAAVSAGMTDGVTMDRVGCEPGRDDRMRVPRLPFGGATPVRRMGVFLSAPWRWYRLREWRDGFPALPARPAVQRS